MWEGDGIGSSQRPHPHSVGSKKERVVLSGKTEAPQAQSTKGSIGSSHSILFRDQLLRQVTPPEMNMLQAKNRVPHPHGRDEHASLVRTMAGGGPLTSREGPYFPWETSTLTPRQRVNHVRHCTLLARQRPVTTGGLLGPMCPRRKRTRPTNFLLPCLFHAQQTQQVQAPGLHAPLGTPCTSRDLVHPWILDTAFRAPGSFGLWKPWRPGGSNASPRPQTEATAPSVAPGGTRWHPTGSKTGHSRQQRPCCLHTPKRRKRFGHFLL